MAFIICASLDEVVEAAQKVLAALSGQLNEIQKEITIMALDISALTNAVTNETTVEQSAITLLGSLSSEIQTLINQSGNTVDPAALQALVNQMNTSQAALAAAVSANTPAAPPTSAQVAPVKS